ncbi:DNA/RNA helicase [Xylanimonas allomyrinae]|uniref:DNA/RNA helicase n=1 Tax=Xylanimonas allomyrinae TaxID=2509459 RepID=A0A4P6ES15_9MICO|nr:DEAD/DEAH box helicase [Xylanimonas allomyrinae]QAY64309.1 DNA/RNA helicase [Xylanimonas allomyrinae]
MAERLVGLDANAISRLVDPGTFARGRAYAQQGRVDALRWDAAEGVLSAEVRGSGRRTYVTWVSLDGSGRGIEAGGCSCPVATTCKHVVALLLHAVGGPAQARPASAPAAAWQQQLDHVLAAAPQVRVPERTTPLALQVRVDGLVRDPARRRPAGRARGRGPAVTTPDLGVSVRPVRQNASGAWAAGWEVSWDALRREHDEGRWDPRVRRWLAELGAMRGQGYWGGSDWTSLAEFPGRLLWPHLALGRELGVPFVGTAKRDVVTLAPQVELVVDATRDDDGVRLTPTVLVGGAPDPSPLRGVLGDHGLFTVTAPDGSAATSGGRAWVLALGPTPTPLAPGAAALLDVGGTVAVPASDEERLYADYLPALRRQVTVRSSDGSVTLPAPPRPSLVLTATFAGAAEATLRAAWLYSASDGVADGHRYAFAPSGADVAVRDLAAERVIVERVEQAAWAAGFDEFTLAARADVTGLAALDLAELLLPVLGALDGVHVQAVDQPLYVELAAAPVIALEARDAQDADWFDLAVTVTVDGHAVPLADVLGGLAHGRKRLLLSDGAWLRLDHPSLERLRLLLAEADGLTDRRSSQLRVTRHQASLWDELAEVADVVEQSEAWRSAVEGLLALTQGRDGARGAASTDAPDVPGGPRPGPILPALPVPEGVRADLRPYQRQGFEWLAFCWEHRLGGILADDMGLGKTLQALTLLAHTREQRPGGPPFLVVAPASVVAGWVAEAERFTPHLRVTAVTATSSRRGAVPLPEAVAGADVVVTSYAVFRLDADAFGALEWGGLVLDEAQFVKNHATRANQHARALRAPFKLAITGTPLENDVTELWSLLAVVAPGLFPSFQRFRADYVRPVEAASRPDADDALRRNAQAVLARLQRRVRPLMLRRTKEQVAPELPPRQEQVLAVDLAPRHRKVYETHLHRERKRVLGLLEDFDANRVAVFRALTTLRRMALDASLVDADAYAAVPSSKLDVLFEQLGEVVAEGHRALVFSQFTGYLSLVAERCREAGIEFAYLDGSTRRRADVVAGFKEGTAPLFLISLKAGGFGLNLTEADYVYLLDPWWNPATEAQAVDRTHRIGQERPVMVVRLVAQGTIEEKVMALKERKARLVDAVLNDDAELFARTIDADDVRALFDE